MIIDSRKVTPNNEFNFPNKGNHSVFFLLKNNLFSLKKIFYSNNKIISITFSKYFYTKNIIDMSYLFYNCESLSFIDITYFNTENVKDMSYMFYGCYIVTSINISNFNTKNVEYRNNLFLNFHRLLSINLSNFNIKKVISMNSIFPIALIEFHLIFQILILKMRNI